MKKHSSEQNLSSSKKILVKKKESIRPVYTEKSNVGMNTGDCVKCHEKDL